MADYPLPVIVDAINQLHDQGWDCYVKWTCAGCGVRCTSDEPNTVHASYRHDEGCGVVTYLRGANYLAVRGAARGLIREEMAKEKGQ